MEGEGGHGGVGGGRSGGGSDLVVGGAGAAAPGRRAAPPGNQSMALPYLSDEVFVNIASSLDIPALGAPGRTAQRFTTRTIADPTRPDDGEIGRAHV